ncbi:MAG TPA: DUF2723 domain-containing protein [Flavipsychrobacter sp.]|nr:DUF2723 domain-containing protein [Flavipsychrobacter sp.]
MNYRKVNNIVGWITFAIAAFVYLTTMEPTVSFWDCGEFISCGYKLEVGHSPGAPFFMLIQRMFGMLAGGNVANVAMMINAWSALASALTILFLFWTITHFAKRLIAPGDATPDSRQLALIMGAGLVGGLAYTFSDTFWFSAVEGEVYATSSFFTAIVFWAMLKWEHIADQKHADRWLLLIFYLMGLSVGIHLLNLLAIPAIALIYYYKRYETTNMGAVMAFVIGCVVLALIQFGVIQGVPWLAFKFDYLFVNSFGLPFDSGAIFFLILFCGVLVWLLFYARKKGNYLMHLSMLCLIFVVIGFLSYLVPVLRSRADVPIDMTNPDNANRFLSYVNREQFGSQPLLFGPDFDSPVESVETKGFFYDQSKKNGKDYYEEVGKKLEYKFGKTRFFPRIWDNNDQNHVRFYRNYLGLSEGESPTSADNMSYFLGVQMNWMWFRYFMWNYAGRQNDYQGHSPGETKAGNWISGIDFIDKMKVGDLDKMADGYKNNKARNELYFLPLILGILGLVYQFNNNKKDGIITFMLFFFTGIAIGIYLNMPPQQPRERDYAFAGSTYAFAIWIGLGVLMVNEWFQKAIKGATGVYAAIAISLLAVPTLMAAENWDDHDRSKKRIAWATAHNTLMSVAPNAVLFTFGDNDTYPLWYLQEVENVRPDVRIVNTSLLGIDWYIDQLTYKVNEADAVPMIWKKKDYVGDRKNYIRYFDNPQIPKDRYFNLSEICNFIISEDQANRLRTMGGDMENYIPSKNFVVNSLTREQLIANGMLNAADSTPITTELKFTFPKDIAYKDDIAVLQIVAAIANDGWKRPLYFGSGMGDNYQGMNDYLKLEGTVYRLVPYKYAVPRQANPGEMGFVDADKSYDLFMKTYKWGGAERTDVYFDEKNRQMLTAYRIDAARVADELTARGRTKEAVQVLDVVTKNITPQSYAYDVPTYYMVISYYRAGAKEKGRQLALALAKNMEDDIKYILSFDSEDRRTSMARDLQNDLTIINILGSVANQSGDPTTGQELTQKFEALAQAVSSKIDMRALQQQ